MSTSFVYEVSEHPQVIIWLRQLAEQNPSGFLRLTEENKKRLSVILGSPIKVFKKSKNKEYAWKFERENMVFWVFSGTMGTFFKVYYPSPYSEFLNNHKVGLQVTNMLSDLLKSLTCSRIAFFKKTKK